MAVTTFKWCIDLAHDIVKLTRDRLSLTRKRLFGVLILESFRKKIGYKVVLKIQVVYQSM